MERNLLYIGLGLVALWLVLSVTRVLVGGVAWAFLFVGLILMVVGGIRYVSTSRRRSTA